MSESSPYAGKTVNVKLKSTHFQLNGLEHIAVVEDRWDKVTGSSWMDAEGNPAAMIYGMRVGLSYGAIPSDNDAVYVKIGPYGHIIHSSEIVDEV